MNRGRFKWSLNDGEVILWQGRPAPRCFVFRRWLQASIGSVLFFACSTWLMSGIHLVRSQNYSWWLIAIPIVLTVASFFVGPGQLLLARWHWENIFYALTDKRLLVRNQLRGGKILSFQRCNFEHYKQKKYGQQLLSLRLSFQGSLPVVLECLEYPDNFLKLLQKRESQAEQLNSW